MPAHTRVIPVRVSEEDDWNFQTSWTHADLTDSHWWTATTEHAPSDGQMLAAASSLYQTVAAGFSIMFQAGCPHWDAALETLAPPAVAML